MIESRREHGVTVFRLVAPRLVFAGLGPFVESVGAELDQAAPRVVVDFTAVNYIDSAAIGCLMDLYRRATSRRGRIVLAGLQERVERMLRMTGAHEFIGFHESPAGAVAALAEAASGDPS